MKQPTFEFVRVTPMRVTFKVKTTKANTKTVTRQPALMTFGYGQQWETWSKAKTQ